MQVARCTGHRVMRRIEIEHDSCVPPDILASTRNHGRQSVKTGERTRIISIYMFTTSSLIHLSTRSVQKSLLVTCAATMWNRSQFRNAEEYLHTPGSTSCVCTHLCPKARHAGLVLELKKTRPKNDHLGNPVYHLNERTKPWKTLTLAAHP